MYEKYLMECGHIANAVDGNGKPCCAICSNEKAFIVKEVIDISKDPTKGLEGRKAKCCDCGHRVNSRWNLPFFEYREGEKEDSYYCGCYGWD